MTDRIESGTPRLKARIAGFIYLAVIAAGAFAMYARSGVIVRGDAAATSANILGSELMYRGAFVADLVGGACYVAVTAILYGVLKPVSPTLSRIAAFFSLAGCAVGAANTVNLMAPLLLLGDAPYLAAFEPGQLQALAMTAVRLDAQGHNIAMMFFGLYCLSLGWLVFRASFLPRVLGLLLALAGVGWLGNSLAVFLAPDVARGLYPWILIPGFIGEVSLTLWLVFVGVNAEKWKGEARV